MRVLVQKGKHFFFFLLLQSLFKEIINLKKDNEKVKGQCSGDTEINSYVCVWVDGTDLFNVQFHMVVHMVMTDGENFVPADCVTHFNHHRKKKGGRQYFHAE